MTTLNGSYELQLYPVFEEGIFERHPQLFDRFTQHASETLREQFRRGRETLMADVGTLTWPLLVGPGLCAGTHPGADNVFVETMVGSNAFVYDSDCLYVSLEQCIFAVSDPPGITDASRRIFKRLDDRLNNNGANLPDILNDMNRRLPVNDGATLTLLSINGSHAQAFIAGDTFLFQGNRNSGTLHEVRGGREFFGTPNTTLKPLDLEVGPNDYFVIASDGVLSLRGEERSRSITDVLREYAAEGLDDLALRVLRQSNRYLEETIYDRKLIRFGGNDNVTVVVVQPGKLVPNHEGSHILGGYVQRRASSSA